MNFKEQLKEDGEIYNDEPVCPYCFYEHPDAWELQMRDDEESEIECHSCSRGFVIRCSISIDYHTSPKKPG